MKLNIKNLGEYIGYMSIAVVCVLSLVLSFGIVDLYEQPIVANAQFDALGETYVDVPVNSYSYVASYNSYFGADNSSRHYLDLDPFVPGNEVLYFVILDFIIEDTSYVLYSYFYPINSYDIVYMPNDNAYFNCIGSSSFAPVEDSYSFLDAMSYSYNIVYDNINEGFWFVLLDLPGTFVDNTPYTLTFYQVPTATSDNSTTESFLSLIGSGITFGFDSIASGITYTMDNLFVVDGELTNFSVIIFLMTGISLALSVLKFVLNFIFSFGGKD